MNPNQNQKQYKSRNKNKNPKTSLNQYQSKEFSYELLNKLYKNKSFFYNYDNNFIQKNKKLSRSGSSSQSRSRQDSPFLKKCSSHLSQLQKFMDPKILNQLPILKKSSQYRKIKTQKSQQKNQTHNKKYPQQQHSSINNSNYLHSSNDLQQLNLYTKSKNHFISNLKKNIHNHNNNRKSYSNQNNYKKPLLIIEQICKQKLPKVNTKMADYYSNSNNNNNKDYHVNNSNSKSKKYNKNSYQKSSSKNKAKINQFSSSAKINLKTQINTHKNTINNENHNNNRNDHHHPYRIKNPNNSNNIKLFKNQYFQSYSKRNSKSIRLMDNLNNFKQQLLSLQDQNQLQQMLLRKHQSKSQRKQKFIQRKIISQNCYNANNRNHLHSNNLSKNSQIDSMSMSKNKNAQVQHRRYNQIPKYEFLYQNSTSINSPSFKKNNLSGVDHNLCKKDKKNKNNQNENVKNNDNDNDNDNDRDNNNDQNDLNHRKRSSRIDKLFLQEYKNISVQIQNYKKNKSKEQPQDILKQSQAIKTLNLNKGSQKILNSKQKKPTPSSSSIIPLKNINMYLIKRNNYKNFDCFDQKLQGLQGQQLAQREKNQELLCRSIGIQDLLLNYQQK